MPGWELIGREEQEEINKIFTESKGVLFAHGFNERRNNIFRVRDLEKKINNYFDVDYSLATTSGTMAQYIAMKAMGIGPGDEVITQSFTFVATIETIISLGATPIIVDINETFNMDPVELERVITKKTKLIIPVHMLGNQCMMDEINLIGKKYNIPVMEDACEGLGGSYKGKLLGTLSEVGVFSLDFGKTITTGEGGLILTNNQLLHKTSKEFHDHGHESNVNLPRGLDTRSEIGLNLRMTEMQAAVGIAQLKKLDYIVKKNRENKRILKNQINNSKIIFRKIVDEDGDLADTLIFYFEDKKNCKLFLKRYEEHGYGTKNVPEAIKWHFAGHMEHMFKDHKNYKDNWNVKWQKSENLLTRSIAIPILVKSDNNQLALQIETINKILSEI